MSLLKVLTFPDPRLKIKARSVEKVDAEVCRLLEDMVETMISFKGIGLAATQVNVPLRMVVIDLPQEEITMPVKLMNPELIDYSEELSTIREGCLSVPGRFAEIKRPKKIGYRFMDETGSVREQEAEGLLSHVIQHEIDHLNGIVFLDHLSPLKRQMALRKKIPVALS